MSTFANIVPRATSTNLNVSYLRSNFIPTATITLNNKSVQILDVLSPTYLAVLKRLSSAKRYTFRTGMQITTAAYNYTDTTSSWWMFIELNGYLHPLQMQEGDVVYTPKQCVQAAINSNATTSSTVAPSTVVF